MGGRRQEQFCLDRASSLNALWSTWVSALHGPMCLRCCSCMLNLVHSQRGSFTGSLGEADGDFHLSTARLNGPPFLQGDSISSQPGSLQLFGRGESILVELQEPCRQRANRNPSQVQKRGTLVSAVGQGPLLQPVLSTLCICSPPVLCCDAIGVFLLQLKPHKLLKQLP